MITEIVPVIVTDRVPAVMIINQAQVLPRRVGRARGQPDAFRSRIAATLLGSPHSSTKPLASRWSKVSPVS